MRRVAAQPFELLALMCATTHCGVQAKAVRIGAQGYGVFLSRPVMVRRLSTFCPARGTGAIRQVLFGRLASGAFYARAATPAALKATPKPDRKYSLSTIILSDPNRSGSL